MDLAGKTAIITGASSGIGAAAARLFAAEGAAVVLGARRGDRLATISDQIARDGGRAACLAGDVRDEAFAAALVDLAESEFGGLDIGFNNAGVIGAQAPVTEIAAPDWHEVLETNLSSGFYAARHQIPALRRRGGGTIIFTSSFVGHGIGLPGMAAYAASKAGLIGLTQVLAVEHGPENIRVNALLPGGTRTGMVAGATPETARWIAGLHALKRMAEPEEIARAALFLASDRASFVTGSALFADGGNAVCKT